MSIIKSTTQGIWKGALRENSFGKVAQQHILNASKYQGFTLSHLVLLMIVQKWSPHPRRMGAVSVCSHENRQAPQYVCGGQIQIVSLGASVFIQWSHLADPMIMNFKAYCFYLLRMGF